MTEGALKADTTYTLSDLPTIGTAGAANWRPALDVLKALGCRRVRLAYDADAWDKAHVARALADCAAGLAAAGFAVELERWDGADGKGIDDLLAAGKAPEVLSGEAAQAAIREALAAATAGEAPAAAPVLERLREALEAGGPEAIYRGTALLRELARLAEDDPGEYACCRAALARAKVRLRDLDAALKPFLREQARERSPALEAAGYRVVDGCLCREHSTPDGGTVLVRLCNFVAHIVEQVTRDDGAERQISLAVEGALQCGQALPRADVPAEAFGRMDWPLQSWGTRAVVYAGAGTKDHLRTALQLLSPDVAECILYAHTGWRKIGEAWVYLHADGAIGANGLVDDILVSLPEPLAGFRLPAPPEGAELADAVRASLGLLRLGPARAMFPLLAAVYRAVLGDTDFALHLTGTTGCFKSEVAALAQQHFGPGMDARHLPANWSSTGNALEGLAFTAKDALLVVDDFCPTGSASDVQRYHKEADRLFRGQGNRSGRQRMRADASLRPSKPPRGLILSTGEDAPRGQSLRARLLVLEISPGDFGPQPPASNPTLSACQGDAAAGKYAAALAGFIRGLAQQYDAIRARLRAELTELRDRARSDGQHARTPGIVADLALGLRYLLDFAQSVGVLSKKDRDDLWQRGWAALAEAAAAQAANITTAEPVGLFLRLLSAALASGYAHVAARDGSEPENPEAWGWRLKTVRAGEHVRDEWQPQGRRIGWVDCADLYLEPEASYAIAQQLARDQGESVSVGAQTLRRRLKDKGLLASTESGKLTNRRTLEGRERTIIHVRTDCLAAGPLFPPKPGESGESGEHPAKHGENPPVSPPRCNGTGAKPGGKTGGIPPEKPVSPPIPPIPPVLGGVGGLPLDNYFVNRADDWEEGSV